MKKSNLDKKHSKKMGLSVDPMEFGLEYDLKIALTELSWIKKTREKLRDSDFRMVAEKYKFPIDFLKKGLKGFSYPEDWLISRSKWFPILYSWVVRDRRYSFNLLKLQIDYVRTRFNSMRFFMILIVVFLYIDFILQILLELDLLQRLSIIVLPFIFSSIALYVELRNNVGSKKVRLDEYSTYLEEMGLGYIIAKNEEFIEQQYKHIILAGKTFLKKMETAPTITAFYIGTEKQEKSTPRSRSLLRKLHLLPKRSTSIEKENIPVFYAENPDAEYIKRIQELEAENEQGYPHSKTSDKHGSYNKRHR